VHVVKHAESVLLHQRVQQRFSDFKRRVVGARRAVLERGGRVHDKEAFHGQQEIGDPHPVGLGARSLGGLD
jgi:hypothetical protein